MAVFDSPIFMSILLIVLVFLLNCLPYFFDKEDTLIEQTIFAIISSTLFIIGSLGALWSLTNRFFIWYISVFVFSYVHFCFSAKRRMHQKLYKVIFLFISLFFILWTTVMFGKYYFDNELVEISDYIPQYNSIIDENIWFPITDFKLSVIFFNISLEKYFTLPNSISLRDPFFIQFILGIIISGTIVSWVIDSIKQFIVPSESN